MSLVARAAFLVAFPVIAGALGAALAAYRRPGPRLTSGVQHFAAGVVLAAVVGEVLPQLRNEGNLLLAVIGFAVGVAGLVMLDVATSRRSSAVASRLPIGLLAAVGVDLLVDGLLVGLGVTLGDTESIVLTIALTLEILFLGIALCLELLDAGWPRARAATVAGGMGLLTAVGAVAGAALLGDASPAVLAAVLAAAAAALLYLVVEELLVEAHTTPDTPLLTVAFFVGFLGLYLLAGLGG